VRPLLNASIVVRTGGQKVADPWFAGGANKPNLAEARHKVIELGLKQDAN